MDLYFRIERWVNLIFWRTVDVCSDAETNPDLGHLQWFMDSDTRSICFWKIGFLFQGHVAVGHIPAFWPGSPHGGHHHGRILASLPRWIHGKHTFQHFPVVFRIRIFHLIRIRGIRIQYFRLHTDPDPGFWWPKIGEKNFGWENSYIFFFCKNCNLLIPRPP